MNKQTNETITKFRERIAKTSKTIYISYMYSCELYYNDLIRIDLIVKIGPFNLHSVTKDKFNTYLT